MSEPNTVNRGFVVPNTGDLSGSWGTAAVNPNWVQVDGSLGGFATISLSAATTLALSASSTPTLTPGPGPYQQSNALLYVTGTLTGNCTLQFSVPGFYIVHNQCGSASNFYVQLAPSSGTGTAVGAPPGKKQHIFYDGTNVDFVNMPDPGTAYDLHGATAIPVWMTACTIKPYLIKDGSIYSTVNYTALGAALGSTFGGNGITTFGVPDERARARIGLDTVQTASLATSGRITFAVAGFTGNLMGAAGGDQNLSAHNHTSTVTDPGHKHNFTASVTNNSYGPGGSAAGALVALGTTASATTNITVAVNTASIGVGGNVQPSIISFLPLIKT